MDTGYLPSDFRYIALKQPISFYVVVVRPESKITTAEEWVAFATSGERFTYTATSAGSTSHLALEIALKEIGSTAGVLVPYAGSSDSLPAVQSGEVDFASLPPHLVVPHVEGGTLRAIVVLGDSPIDLLPGVPLVSDLGIEGPERISTFQLVAVHRDTPDAIVQFITERVNAAILSDAFQEHMRQVNGVDHFATVTEEWLTDLVNMSYDTLVQEIAALN
jgi:tripartite-type tricarboxylate transporter receptor subunit TctC